MEFELLYLKKEYYNNKIHKRLKKSLHLCRLYIPEEIDGDEIISQKLAEELEEQQQQSFWTDFKQAVALALHKKLNPSLCVVELLAEKV